MHMPTGFIENDAEYAAAFMQLNNLLALQPTHEINVEIDWLASEMDYYLLKQHPGTISIH